MTKLSTDCVSFSFDTRPIHALIGLIVEAWNPEQIWLFGSRAKGTHTAYSDWDLLVVTPNENQENDLSRERMAWKLRKKTNINADILFCSTDEFELYSPIPNTLAYEVKKTGGVVYDRRGTKSEAADDRKPLANCSRRS